MRLGKGERYPVVELGREGDEVYGEGRYSRWMILRMNFGTTGPERKGLDRGSVPASFLSARVTLTMKHIMRLRSIVITAICARTPACLSPRIFGLSRMHKSSLAAELVLSEAERRALIF